MDSCQISGIQDQSLEPCREAAAQKKMRRRRNKSHRVISFAPEEAEEDSRMATWRQPSCINLNLAKLLGNIRTA